MCILKCGKFCIGGVACKIDAGIVYYRSLSPTLFLSYTFNPLSFFVSHIYIFPSLCHTHTNVPLSRTVQRTREPGACAAPRGRNCRYAAKVEDYTTRQPDYPGSSSFPFIFLLFSRRKVIAHS